MSKLDAPRGLGRRTPVIVAAVVMVAAAAVLAQQRMRTRPAQPVAPDPLPTFAASTASASVDMRALSGEMSRYYVAALGPNPDEQQVEALLSRLEAQARRKRQVTALEVEPGLRAIEALGPRLSADRIEVKRGLFTNYMGRLSAEFRSEGPPRTPRSVSVLAEQLTRASSEAQKQAAISEYLHSVENPR